MSRLAKSIFKHFLILLFGAFLGLTLLSWYLNHSQCEGFMWNGELGMPLIMRADSLNCMKTGARQEYTGVWEFGHEVNSFYHLDSISNELMPKEDPFSLNINDATIFLIREKLELDDNIYDRQKYKIKFRGNLTKNYYKGSSVYRNHYDVRQIESISVFEGDIPRVRRPN